MIRVLSSAAAAVEVNPAAPPSRETLNFWHGRVGGPRDSAGRRIFTPEVCAQIRAARAERRAVSAVA